jgi:hypothetical protein
MDIPDSMRDDEGNISMFLDQRQPSANYDQVTASHEDQDVSQAQQLNCDTADRDIDATLNPNSVMPPPEGDSNLFSRDLQDTAQTQLNDNIHLDADTGPSQSWDSNSSEEQVGRHQQTKRNSLPSHQSNRATKRARVTPDATSGQANSTTIDALSGSESPEQNENPEIAEPDTRSHYLRSFETMTSKYGKGTDSNLNPAQIIDVIRAGDSFLLERSVEFVSSYLESCRDGVWNTPIPCSPFNGPLTENLFKSFHCAEILDQRTIVDPIRFRVARILLFWNYEQLLNNPELLSRISRGRDSASIATDVLLQEIFKHDTRDWKRRRMSLQRHKHVGKRWSMVIGCIGPGFLLMCNTSLATHL